MPSWFKRVAFTTLVLLSLMAAVYWAWLPGSTTIDRESYAALSSYLTQRLTGNSHDLGSRNGIVILYGRTTNGMYRFLPPKWFRFNSGMMRVEAVLRSLDTQSWEHKFALDALYVFTNDASGKASDLTDQQKMLGYGTITFSKAIFNHDATYVIFYTEHLCGLCGGGRFVAMEKHDGKWVVVDEEYTWVS